MYICVCDREKKRERKVEKIETENKEKGRERTKYEN